MITSAGSTRGMRQRLRRAVPQYDAMTLSRRGARRLDLVRLHAFLRAMGVSLASFARRMERGWHVYTQICGLVDPVRRTL